MKYKSKNTTQVRITEQAREHLDKIIPMRRAQSGLNVTMVDVLSEAILSIPLETQSPTTPITKRRTRKADATAPAQVPA